jgi:hypothetical protein
VLVDEQNRLRGEVDKQQRETGRLSTLAKQQLRDNARLDEQLRATEGARAIAMRHLSDMQETSVPTLSASKRAG